MRQGRGRASSRPPLFSLARIAVGPPPARDARHGSISPSSVSFLTLGATPSRFSPLLASLDRLWLRHLAGRRFAALRYDARLITWRGGPGRPVAGEFAQFISGATSGCRCRASPARLGLYRLFPLVLRTWLFHSAVDELHVTCRRRAGRVCAAQYDFTSGDWARLMADDCRPPRTATRRSRLAAAILMMAHAIRRLSLRMLLVIGVALPAIRHRVSRRRAYAMRAGISRSRRRHRCRRTAVDDTRILVEFTGQDIGDAATRRRLADAR